MNNKEEEGVKNLYYSNGEENLQMVTDIHDTLSLSISYN